MPLKDALMSSLLRASETNEVLEMIAENQDTSIVEAKNSFDSLTAALKDLDDNNKDSQVSFYSRTWAFHCNKPL